MKKNYIQPKTNVMSIRTQHQLLTGSLSGEYVKSGNADSSENFSRGGGSFWDDDDE